jgi:hypothetical protein
MVTLRGHSSTLANYLNDFPALADQASQELVRLEATLKSLEPKLHGEAQRSVRSLLSRLRGRSGTLDELGIRRIQRSVIGVIEEIKNLQEDSEWQR